MFLEKKKKENINIKDFIKISLNKIIKNRHTQGRVSGGKEACEGCFSEGEGGSGDRPRIDGRAHPWIRGTVGHPIFHVASGRSHVELRGKETTDYFISHEN